MELNANSASTYSSVRMSEKPTVFGKGGKGDRSLKCFVLKHALIDGVEGFE
jgi:hypothetical protein